MRRNKLAPNMDYGKLAHPNMYEWHCNPTNHLRWKQGKLQQLWLGQDSQQYEYEWREVETVPDEAEDSQ